MIDNILNILLEEEKETLIQNINELSERCKKCKHLKYFHQENYNGPFGYIGHCDILECQCDNSCACW